MSIALLVPIPPKPVMLTVPVVVMLVLVLLFISSMAPDVETRVTFPAPTLIPGVSPKFMAPVAVVRLRLRLPDETLISVKVRSVPASVTVKVKFPLSTME